MELGFFPTKGRYDAAAVFRAATEAATDPWPLLTADGRALTAFLKRRPDAERALTPGWTPSPPWFGHRKAKNAARSARDTNRSHQGAASAPGTEPCPADEHDTP